MNGILFFIYALISALFLYKYGSRITTHAWIFACLYSAVASVAIFRLPKFFPVLFRKYPSGKTLFFIVAVLCLFFIALMMQFDPRVIRVTRVEALSEWITTLLKGEYPYGASSNPSSFPFLFFLAMPFYFIGDLGFLQIVGFILLVLVARYRYKGDANGFITSLILLLACPIFWYELVVRSELFFNMVIVLVFLIYLEGRLKRGQTRGLFWFGIISGLLLSTRGIVLLPMISVIIWMFRKNMIKSKAFFLAVLFGFFLTILPFIFWDWELFQLSGPFSIQTSYLPMWMTFLSLVFCFIIGWKIPDIRRVYALTGIVVFLTITASLVYISSLLSWREAILQDAFDVGYFAFVIPFLLLSLDLSEKSKVINYVKST